MKRAAIYIRVSTVDQNLGMQERELTEFTQARGWAARIYSDRGYSGTHEKRPGLQSMLKDARSRKVDVVLIWKLDRLFRSLKHLVTTLQDLADLGIEFVSLKDNIDLTTSSGRLLLHILAAFGQFESDIIRERVRSGLANAKANGQKLGRPKLRDDDEIRRLRQQGYSYRAIARELRITISAVQRGLKT